MRYFEYDENGKIGGVYSIPEWEFETNPFYRNMRLAKADNELDEIIPPTHYVADGKIVKRPTMPLSVSGATITGIPAGSVLTLGEQSFEVDDGEADIDGYSGTVKITCWPYLDAEVVV